MISPLTAVKTVMDVSPDFPKSMMVDARESMIKVRSL